MQFSYLKKLLICIAYDDDDDDDECITHSIHATYRFLLRGSCACYI